MTINQRETQLTELTELTELTDHDDVTLETHETHEQHALTTDELGTFNLSDLMEYEMPPQRWAIDGLVPTGLTILAGRPKFGKSWFAFDMCLAVATGGKVLERPAQQGTALYLALEDTRRRLQERARILLGAEPAPSGLRVRTEWKRLLDQEGGLRDLECFLDQYPDTRLIVIDVIKKVAPPHTTNRNQYDYDYALVASLKRLADAHNVAIVIVTHLTKYTDDDDPFVEISGSTGTTGAMDTGIIMRKHKQGKYKELCIRGRDVSEDRFRITFDEQTCRWQRDTTSNDPFAHLGLTNDQHAVADLLWLNTDTVQPKEVAEMLRCSVNAANKHLLHLIGLGVAERAGYGKYCLAEEFRRMRQEEEGREHAVVAA